MLSGRDCCRLDPIDDAGDFMFLILTFKNLKHIIKNNTVLFLFIAISQIICIMAVFTVSGMMDAVAPEPEDKRAETEKSFYIGLADWGDSENQIFKTVMFDKNGKCIYQGIDEKEIEKIYDLYKENELVVNNIQIPVNYKTLPKYKDVSNNIKKVLNSAKDYFVYIKVSGYTDSSLFTEYSAFYGDKEFMQSHYPEFALSNKHISLSITSGLETPLFGYEEGDTIKLNNTEYIVASINESAEEEAYDNSLRLNMNDMDEDFLVKNISILITDNATRDQLGQISETINSEFGSLAGDIQNPQPKPLMEKQFNNMIYVISFILMAVVLLNVSRIYTYLLNRRKHTLSVYLICGANKMNIFLICISEVLLIMITAVLFGTLLFNFVLSDLISVLYPTFKEFFTAEIYLMISGLYLMTGLVIMTLSIIPSVRKTAYGLSR